MTTSTNYVSFLIRLWCETSQDPPESATAWRGEIVFIQSGRRWTFSSLDKLLEFFRWPGEDPAAWGRSLDEKSVGAPKDDENVAQDDSSL